MTKNLISTRGIWPGVILGSAVATFILFFVGTASPFRVVITLWFLLVCPGMAFIKLLRFDELFYEWTLAIAVSISLDAMIACCLLYIGFWSITLGLSILIALSFLGVFLQLVSTQPTFISAPTEAGVPTTTFTSTFTLMNMTTVTEIVTPAATAIADLILVDRIESEDLSI